MKNKNNKKVNNSKKEVIDRKVKTMNNGKDYYESVSEDKLTKEKDEN